MNSHAVTALVALHTIKGELEIALDVVKRFERGEVSVGYVVGLVGASLSVIDRESHIARSALMATEKAPPEQG